MASGLRTRGPERAHPDTAACFMSEASACGRRSLARAHRLGKPTRHRRQPAVVAAACLRLLIVAFLDPPDPLPQTRLVQTVSAQIGLVQNG